MDYKEIMQAVMEEAKQFIADGKDCNNAPLYIKLGQTFTDCQSKNHWKNPFTAVVNDPERREWLKAAIVWYHGCLPLVDKVNDNWYISSVGYSC